MRTITITSGSRSQTVWFPTREDVEGLKVGDLAPTPFGSPQPVTRIFAQRDDVRGRAFCCYYTATGWGSSQISNSIRQDEVVRDLHTTRSFSSREIDMAESLARANTTATVEAR